MKMRQRTKFENSAIPRPQSNPEVETRSRCRAINVEPSSSLRQAVRKLDKVKPPRTFGDKDEWKAALRLLSDAGKLTYIEATDSIVLQAAEEA